MVTARCYTPVSTSTHPNMTLESPPNEPTLCAKMMAVLDRLCAGEPFNQVVEETGITASVSDALAKERAVASAATLSQAEILDILSEEMERPGSDAYSVLKQIAGILADAGPPAHAAISMMGETSAA